MNTRKILFALLLSLPTLSLSTNSTAATPADTDTFDAYLDGLIAAQFNDYNLAGMTLVVVQGDTITTMKGAGLADVESGEPVDPTRHLFRPGSVSKLFTWTAVMQLVEQGKLDLNADVSQYVDQFEIPQAFDQPLTLTHIMTHTPGLEDGGAGYLFEESADDLVPLAESLASHTPTQVRAPGTHASYSNWATALAGLIVANVSGKSFEDYVTDHIFQPLQMNHATFDEPLPDHLAPDMATGYIAKQGALEPLGFEFIRNFGPAGALSATSADMAHFMIAHLNQGQYDGAQILQPAVTELMHQKLFAHHEGVAAMAHGFYEIWRNGHRFVGHGGDTIAFHSQLVLDPANRFGFFLSFNAPDGARARAAVVNGIIDFFYPAAAPRFTFATIPGSAERIAEVTGAYRVNRRSYTQMEGIVGLAGDLSVVPGPDGTIFVPNPSGGGRFAEVEPYVFDQVGKEGRLVFTKDAAGAVGHLLIGNTPILVADKLGALETAANHQLVILLALVASLFVVINTIRNRKDGLTGTPQRARRFVTAAAAANLIFICGLAIITTSIDMQRVIFEFPPAGVPFILIFPIISLFFTLAALYYLWPVWKTPECNRWASLRYTYVTVVFVLFLAVLNYWNLIGWKY